MQRFAELKLWLDKGISENPQMLHGTSIESVFELVNTGRLPTGTLEIYEDEICCDNHGYLFFTPITSNLKEKIEGLAYVEKETSFETTKRYASTLGFAHYLTSRLNCQTAEGYNAIFLNWLGETGQDEVPEKMKHALFLGVQHELRNQGIDLSLRRMFLLDSNARKRRGAAIEPSKSIIELPHEVGWDDNTAISFYCPNGLEKKYIQGIKLLGPVEERQMERFLDGRLKYRGFKTEVKKL